MKQVNVWSYANGFQMAKLLQISKFKRDFNDQNPKAPNRMFAKEIVLGSNRGFTLEWAGFQGANMSEWWSTGVLV